MAAKPIISMSEKWQGAAPIDGKTPINFFVGTVAGLSGLNPSWAAVVVIGFEAVLVVLDEGFGAAFEKRSPQSYGNAAVDTLVGIAGVYYGEWLKNHNKRIAQARATQQPSGAQAVNTQIPTTNVAPITEVSGVPWYR